MMKKRRCFQTVFPLFAGLVFLLVYMEMFFAMRRGKPEGLPITQISFYGYGPTIVRQRCPGKMHIVVLVMTRPTALKNRKAIRETWMREYDPEHLSVTVKFVIGTLSITTNVSRTLVNEQNQYDDLLLLDRLNDTYLNLPSKVVMSMTWVSKNMNFDYLVKVDDDMYLRIEALLHSLHQMNCEEMLYWGRFLHGTPEKKGPNIEHNWHICSHYFPYATGGCYVFSEKVIKSAMPSSKHIKLYNNEDVSIGAMVAPFNLYRVHDTRFITHGTHCFNDFILLNVKDTDRLYEIQIKLSQAQEFCKDWSAK